MITPTTPPPDELGAASCSGFVACEGCDDEMCEQIGQCVASIHAEAQKIEDDYIAAGKCNDCGACSLAEAEGKCRPRALGDTGDVTCAGELLWRDEDE